MPFQISSMKLLFIACLFLMSGLSLKAKGIMDVPALEDSIVKMHGYIYDTISVHPQKVGVEAKMILESQPHGSEIGIITSVDTSGYYEYFINLSHEYKIDIRSEKHRWFFENLEPKKAVINGEIVRNYYLEPQVKENQVIRLNKLIFEQGQSTITENSYEELNKLVKLMEENPQMIIQLEGHTDFRGGKRSNMALSQDRVYAVKAYLMGKGINSKRIKTKAFGGTNPLVRESSIKASEINRRVEVRILKLQ